MRTRLYYLHFTLLLAITVFAANPVYGANYKAIDLNPSGSSLSYAYGVNGTQQAGYSNDSATGGADHALIWNRSSTSYVDLNPSGFSVSYANKTNGTQQAGYGHGSATGGNEHALLWSGTANNYIDLSQFLPTGLTSVCYANSIDSYGNIVGSALDSYGNAHAILWEPVPEPCTLLLLGLGAAIVRKKHR